MDIKDFRKATGTGTTTLTVEAYNFLVDKCNRLQDFSDAVNKILKEDIITREKSQIEWAKVVLIHELEEKKKSKKRSEY